MRIDLRDRTDLKDPQSAPIIGYCIHCGGEIYVGDTVYIPEGYAGMVCTDCVKDWFFENHVNDFGSWCEAKA